MSIFLYLDKESSYVFICEVEHHKPDPNIPAAGGPYTVLYTCKISDGTDIYHLLSQYYIQKIEEQAQWEHAGD